MQEILEGKDFVIDPEKTKAFLDEAAVKIQEIVERKGGITTKEIQDILGFYNPIEDKCYTFHKTKRSSGRYPWPNKES